MKKSKKIKEVVKKEVNDTFFTFSEPIFNEQTKLFELKKENKDGEVLDIISDVDENKLKERKEELIKEYILSQINKKKKEYPKSQQQIEGKKNRENKQNIKDEIITEIIRRKLGGDTLSTIIKDLSLQFNTSRMNIGIYLPEAANQIKQRAALIIEDVLELHLNRYEKLYKWLSEKGFIRNAVKVLKAKEALMGVGNDIVGVQINNFMGDIRANFSSHDISKLDKKQRMKLLELYKKLKA